MDNLKTFDDFLNESKRYYTNYSDAERKIKEIRSRISAETPQEKIYQTTYDEAGALKRLLKGAINSLAGLTSGISDLFNNGRTSSMSADALRGSQDEILSKWGDDIRRKGNNKEADYEKFYRDAILKGRKSFGGKFDPENPEGKEQSIYAEYVNNASKYFNFK